MGGIDILKYILDMGNNPMVGATVAVLIEEAAKEGKF